MKNILKATIPAQLNVISNPHLQVCEAEDLEALVLAHAGQEGYTFAFDVGEPINDTYKGYNGIAGPLWGSIWIDFDSEIDMGLSAFKDAMSVVRNMPQYRVWFSGLKGFHVELPAAMFAAPIGTEHYTRVIKNIILGKYSNLETIDKGIYQANRLLRAPYSKHPKSGLHKILLSPAQLEQMQLLDDPISYVRTLAETCSPPTSFVAKWGHVTDAHILSAASVPAATELVPASKVTNKYKGLKPCVKSLSELPAREGTIHDTFMVLAADLKQRDFQESNIFREMTLWGNRHNLPARDIDRWTRDVIEGSIDYGCNNPLKIENCSQACPLFSALPPDRQEMTPNFDPTFNNKKMKRNEALLIKDYMLAIQGERKFYSYGRTLWEYHAEKGCFSCVSVNDTLMEKLKLEMANYMGIDFGKVDSTFRRFVANQPTFKNPPTNGNDNSISFIDGTFIAKRNEAGKFESSFVPHSPHNECFNYINYRYSDVVRAYGNGTERVPGVFTQTINNLFGTEADALKEQDFDGLALRAEKILALQELLGSCLSMPYAMSFLLIGKPKTGKSSVCALVASLLGQENISLIAPSDFKGFNLVNMIGKRANIDQDVDTTQAISESFFKKIIDRTPYLVKTKYEKDQTAVGPPLHLYASNGLLKLAERNGEAHERRWVVIEFTHPIKAGYNSANDWVQSLAPAMPYIIGWAIEGAKRVIDGAGVFTRPESGKKILRELWTMNNPADQFLQSVQEGEVGGVRMGTDKDRASRKAIYDAFNIWQTSHLKNSSRIDASEFYQLLEGRLRASKYAGSRVFYGISVANSGE